MTVVEIKQIIADTELKQAQTVKTWLIISGLVFTGFGAAVVIFIQNITGA